MNNLETNALYVVSCVLCGHLLAVHHETSCRCQHTSKPHWWTKRRQCPCDMDKPLSGETR